MAAAPGLLPLPLDPDRRLPPPSLRPQIPREISSPTWFFALLLRACQAVMLPILLLPAASSVSASAVLVLGHGIHGLHKRRAGPPEQGGAQHPGPRAAGRRPPIHGLTFTGFPPPVRLRDDLEEDRVSHHGRRRRGDRTE